MSRIGAEGFGLMGFFLMLQSWMQILDAGVGGSLSRQVAITKQNISVFNSFLKQFYIVVLVFFMIALLIFTLGYYGKTFVAVSWIDSSIAIGTLEACLLAMFASLAVRYVLGPFRSGLIGLERHAAISLSSVVFSSLKFPVGLYVLNVFDNSLVHYFFYQSLLSVLELAILSFLFIVYSNSIRKSSVSDSRGIECISLKSLIKFSAQLSFLSIVWVVVTQVDKLVLSKYLSLEEYGYYSLAVSVSGVILLLSAPLSQVLMPRLTSLAAKGKKNEYLQLYVNSIWGMSIFIISTAGFLVFYSDELLLVWTGRVSVAERSYIYAGWLALGNAISVLMNFVFILQYSLGQLSRHVLVYTVYAAVLIPASIFIAYNYGAFGIVIFWFVHNLLFYLVWGSLVHSKYIGGVAKYVWLKIMTPCVAITFLYMYSLKEVVVFDYNRLAAFFLLAAIGLTNILLVLGYFWLAEKLGYMNKSALCLKLFEGGGNDE